MKSILVVAPLTLLVACATEAEKSGGQQVASSDREEVVVCGMEEPTGSKLRVKRCWTKQQLEQEGQDARKVIERGQLVRPTPQTPGNAGR
jgi:hypothetical protein